MKQKSQPLNIAVVGLATLYPQAVSPQEFWHNIFTAKNLIRDIPASHWLIEDYFNPDPNAQDQTYSKRGAFLDPLAFDAFEFKIPPNILASTDTSQLLTLLATKQLLQDYCQGAFTHLDLSRASVILGTTGAQELMLNAASRLEKPIWLEALRQHKIPESQAQEICQSIASLYVPWTESTFPGLLGNVLAGRVANYFNTGGTNCVVDAACASSFSALAMGINELTLHQADLVITGGVDTMQHIAMYMCFSKTPALSKTGDCRPFAEDADGTMLGEGIGLLALKRLADAERDGDSIYAVIQGLGTSSDGSGKSVHVPDAQGQAQAIKRAYEQAGYSPDKVGLLEAHGTGTIAGDAAEFAGLKQVFATRKKNKITQWCALGSIKSQIGHTKGAAGAAGLIKTILALHNKVLPPTIKIKQPNPKLHIDTSPFYLNTYARPWFQANSEPRRAGVSAFGFGGANFHVTLEEYTGQGKRPSIIRTNPTEFIIVSATDKEALISQCQKLCAQATSTTLSELAYQTQHQHHHNNSFRLALVARADNYTDQLQKALSMLQTNSSPAHADIYFTEQALAGKMAFLFPGQGSQYLNMGADIAMTFPIANTVWNTAAAHPFVDKLALTTIVFPPPTFTIAQSAQKTAQLAQTEWTQPALATTSMALFKLLSALNVQADCMAGHSFGEIVALSAAGWCDFTTLLNIARRRGELMAQASSNHAGIMLAIIHPMVEILDLLIELNLEAVSIANYNSPKQIVVSGETIAVLQLEQVLINKKWTYHRLPVASAFHSPMVADACKPFAVWLQDQDFQPSHFPVYSNVTTQPYLANIVTMRANLVKQLVEPVQFMQQIKTMYADGVRTFVEVGPGSILTRLVGECLTDKKHLAICLDKKGEHGVTQLWRGLAQLFVNGVELDFKPLWENYTPTISKLNTGATTKTTVMIQGSNFAKPYPPAGGAKGRTQPQPEIQPHLITMEQHMSILNNNNPPFSPSNSQQQNRVATEPLTPTVQAPSNPAYNLEAVIHFEQQIVNAHTAYQRAMAESHIVFLQTAERILTMMSGQQPSPNQPNSIPLPAGLQVNPSNYAFMNSPISNIPPVNVPSPMTTLAAYPPSSQAVMPPAPPSFRPPQPPVMSASISSPEINFSAVSSATLAAAPAIDTPSAFMHAVNSIPSHLTTAPIPSISVASVEQQLLSIVAEKTGYPIEMLNLQMDMEADLGIDSIKRVEILSAAQQQIHNLPAIDANDMAALKTLEEIANYLKKQMQGN